MRKLLLSILLASAVATPVLADPPTREEREKAREERQQARQQSRDDRQQSREQSRSEQAQPQKQVRQQPVQPTARMQTIQPANNAQAARDRAARQQVRTDARDQRIDQRQQLRQDRVDQRQDRIEARQVRQAARAPVVSRTPRPGTQPPLRVDNRRSSTPRWSTSWKNNNKYDWHGWRKKHRSLFHLGFYFDPFGWGYQPYSIGWRLWPSYYSSRYWINNPYQYRLPYAPPGYQWVRYWNDAILVDTWTGEVVDVLYNFFW